MLPMLLCPSVGAAVSGARHLPNVTFGYGRAAETAAPTRYIKLIQRMGGYNDMKKLPPIEKIPEAWTAVTDGRVHPQGDIHAAEGVAEVASSDGAKTYTVTWQENVYTSNDNATYWRGYPGYPVLAVMMLQGCLPLDTDVARMFADVNWTELNGRYKANYAAALDELITQRQLPRERVNDGMEAVMQALSALEATVRRGKPLRNGK